MSDKLKIVFYSMEKGCGFCEKMRSIVAEYKEKHPEVEVEEIKLKSYNDVPDPFKKVVPLFVAYKNEEVVSVQEGAIPLELLELAFTPEKLPPKQVKIEEAPLLVLIQEEANLIDQLQPLLTKLNKIKKEIKKRKSLIDGESCCEGCATGGGCSGGSCGGH